MHAKPILFSGMSERSNESTTLDESHPAAEEVQSDSEVIGWMVCYCKNQPIPATVSDCQKFWYTWHSKVSVGI